MFGLRQKLALGFGGLLLILLTVSALGVAVLRQHRVALDKFLFENWRSVEYGHRMLDALDQLNNAAAVATPAPDALAAFDRNLEDENHNITLAGEDRLASELTSAWRDAGGYRANYLKATNAKLDAAAREAARERLKALAVRVKAAAGAIVRLNLENMRPIDGRAKALADSASRLMLILAAAGVALATLFIAVVGRSILKPIGDVTRSAREIEQGNLDLVVQVKGRDELRQLAEAFNSMAAKLREYRRTDRAKLARTQQTTQNAINSLPDAVAIVSPEGRVEMANAAARRLFGLRAGAHVSEQRTDWLAKLYQQTAALMRPIEPRGYESALQVLDEGGGERFFLPHAVPILDNDRQLLGVTVVLADVTNLRRLDEMKSGMLSVVSHELRTPLTSIRMGVHLVLEERIGALNGQQSELLNAVREDADRLHRIVENLLDMSRIESGRALIDLRPEPVARVVREAVEPMGAAFHDRGVALRIDVPDDVPPVMVDPTRIGLVFSNLLTNALKFTPPGGQVTVSAVAAGEEVRFAVTDTGPGIKREHLPHVFERFFRAPGQSGATGAGLGLAIAKEVVEAHGGRIGVESIEQRGTKFTFTVRQAGESQKVQHGHDDDEPNGWQNRNGNGAAAAAHPDRG